MNRPIDLLTDEPPPGQRRSGTSPALIVGVLVAALLAGLGAQVLQREQASKAEHAAQDRIDVTTRPGRTSLGAGGNFFVTALVANVGPDLVQAVDSRWHGIGLEAVTEIGGLGPIAPGTSASFVARVAPDCGVVRSTPDVLAGRFDLVFQAPSGRRREVRLQLDRELELLGTARATCADAAQPTTSMRPPRLLRVSATEVDLGLRLPDTGAARVSAMVWTPAGQLLLAAPALLVVNGRRPDDYRLAVLTIGVNAAGCRVLAEPSQRRRPMIVTVRRTAAQQGSLAVTLDSAAFTAVLVVLAAGCPGAGVP